MSDLISRQAALECVYGSSPKNIKGRIVELPTAEKKGEWIPVVDGNYIIWECSECHVESEAWTDYCPICGSRNIEINREAVIDATDEAAYEEALEEFRKNPKTYTLDEVEAELGLTAEKKGKWEEYCGDLICDQCRNVVEIYGNKGKWNYCPNCGCRMMEDDMR